MQFILMLIFDDFHLPDVFLMNGSNRLHTIHGRGRTGRRSRTGRCRAGGRGCAGRGRAGRGRAGGRTRERGGRRQRRV